MTGHAWLHPTKSSTLKSNFFVITFSMEKESMTMNASFGRYCQFNESYNLIRQEDILVNHFESLYNT